VARHVKELKAFCRIMLQAGESRTVELSVPVNRLAYWDENLSDWTIEKTSYLAYVGSSSAVHDVTVLPFEVR
jgi:beta-glucosidase